MKIYTTIERSIALASNNLSRNIIQLYQEYPDLKRSINNHLRDMSYRRFNFDDQVANTPGKILAYLGGNYPPSQIEKMFYGGITYQQLVDAGLFKVVEDPKDGPMLWAAYSDIDQFI